MDEKLEERKPYDVTRPHRQNTEQWQHPKRIDEVRQSFSGIVDLNGPAKMEMQVFRGLNHIRRLNDPFASTGWKKESEHG